MDERFIISADNHARKAVDAFLTAPKTLAGIGEWREFQGESRVRWQVALDDVPTDMFVEVIAYPIGQMQPFTIGLHWPPCIWRVDFEPNFKSHNNPIGDDWKAPRTIYGPHYHSWADNRHLAKPVRPPSDLDWARELPAEIKRFEHAFRWFCGETNIVLENSQVLDLPTKGFL